MDIATLVKRLEELSKTTDVELFIFFREGGMFGENENVIEYVRIENKLKNLLIEEINLRSLHIFENISLRNFDLFDIERQLGKLVYPHWNSRNEVEILRDELLAINSYGYHYKSVEKFKELLEINVTRKEFKEEVKQIIISDFKRRFVNELNSNKLQGILQKLDGYYFTYLKVRAQEYFKSRNADIIDRDAFGYINIETYQSCFATSLQQAIEFNQSTFKVETIELYLIFLRNIVSESNAEKYQGNIDNELYNYASNLFDNRNQNKIEDDNFRLIKLATYFNWRHSAIKQIEIEYPDKFAEEDYEVDYDDF